MTITAQGVSVKSPSAKALFRSRSFPASSSSCPGGVKFAATLLFGLFLFMLGQTEPVLSEERLPDRLTMIIGYDAGGGYDIYGRFIARYMTDHLPGNPRIVAQNMPGASSLNAANHLYNVAARDGSILGVVGQGIALSQMLNQSGIKFDAAKLSWIGRITDVNDLIGVWHMVPVKTVAEARQNEVSIAIGAALSGSTLYVRFLNALTGTKFKPVAGYSSIESLLAMERGEIDGTASISSAFLNASRPDWLSTGKVRVLVQAGMTADPKFPGVPRMTDLALNDDDRVVLGTLATIEGIGFAVTAPPNLPPAVLAMLRTGFMATVNDPVAISEAARQRIDLGPLSGVELQALIEQFFRVPPATVERIRDLAISEGAKK